MSWLARSGGQGTWLWWGEVLVQGASVGRASARLDVGFLVAVRLMDRAFVRVALTECSCGLNVCDFHC